MAPQKMRKYEHHGIVFSVVPGSKRERLLQDMFQAHDSAATRPSIVDAGEPDGKGFFFLSLGFLSGFVIGFGIGWLI